MRACGFVAHGVFEAYGTIGDTPASAYTRAKLFQTKGGKTPVSARFSTVTGAPSEVARDTRGFAVKFRTDDGNWDLVGSNLPVSFIRDAIKLPDVVHALKPDPITFRQQPNRIFDFMANTPESMHMLVWLFSPRGIPANYRTQDGFDVNTYRMVNACGVAVLVKYHWKSQQGIESLTAAQAAKIQAEDPGHASRDMYEAIERGDHPRWELNVQIMSDGEHPELDFDPLDDTKIWPEDRFALRPAGMMTLTRNGNEQIAFGTGVLVDGLDVKQVMRGPIARRNNYRQAGERYRTFERWEREDLVLNLVTMLGRCEKRVQEKMIWHLSQCDDDLGQQVSDGLGVDYSSTRA